MARVRISRFVPLLCSALLVSAVWGQQEAAPSSTRPVAPVAAQAPAGPERETLAPADVARRNELMKPGLALLKKGDADGAYKALWPARKAFPDDLRVARYSAEAAFFSHHDREALDLFHRALAQHPYEPWPLRLAILQLNARLGRWDDFDQGLAELIQAKKSYTDHQLDSSSGFLIDGFEAGAGETKVQVQTIVFPLQADPYHTLFRFLLPKQSPAKTSIQAGVNDDQGDPSCKNPDFRPYIDLESDDVDQAAFKQAHPELAAQGERSYSLDTYSAPCSQGLMKFYNGGRPKYETVREDVLKALATTPQTDQPAPGEQPAAEKPSGPR
jgi:hypothetical protein